VCLFIWLYVPNVATRNMENIISEKVILWISDVQMVICRVTYPVSLFIICLGCQIFRKRQQSPVSTLGKILNALRHYCVLRQRNFSSETSLAFSHMFESFPRLEPPVHIAYHLGIFSRILERRPLVFHHEYSEMVLVGS
jgi:hypothetical protein